MSKMTGYRRILAYGVPFEAFTRDVWLICLSCIIGAFGEGLYFWVFPLYVRLLHADYVQLGLVFSALYGVSALVILAGGFLSDRFDRKKLLIIGWMLWIFAPLIYSFAEDWTQLVPGTICWGVSNIGAPAINVYVVTSITDNKKVASVLSFVWSTFSFSYIFAPTVGGYLTTIAGMKSVFYLSTLLIAVSTCVMFFLPSQLPMRNKVEKHRFTLASSEEKPLLRKLLIWSGFFVLVTFFTTLARTFLPTFLNEQLKLSEFYVGLFGSINFAGITFIGIAMGRLGDRWKKSGAMTICLLLFITSIVPMLLVRDPAILMLLAFIYGGSAVTASLVTSLVGTIAPEARRGLWLAIPQSLGLVAGFAAPYLGGFLYTFSPYYVFIVSVSAIPFLLIFALIGLKD